MFYLSNTPLITAKNYLNFMFEFKMLIAIELYSENRQQISHFIAFARKLTNTM